MTEKTLWGYLRNKTAGRGAFERVENGVAEGTPDVDYLTDGIDGWIELKWLKKMPRSKVKIGIRDSQYAWFRRRLKHTPMHNFVLAQIDREYFLFCIYNSEILAALYHGCTEMELRAYADAIWQGGIDVDEFIEAIGGVSG